MLGVAVGLGPALEDQFQRRLEGHAVGVSGHRRIGGVAGVLAVHHRRHAGEGLADLGLGADPVVQPVGDVLAGDPECGAVLHQADVVDVRHLGAAHALVDPADHVAEDALGVVVQFLLDLLRAPVRTGEGRGEQGVEARARPAGQAGLKGRDVHLMVVQGVQGGGGGRGDPGGVGPGLRMPDLGGQHVLHHVRRGPHALADLGPAGEAGGEADLDIALLVGRQPAFGLHGVLADHGPGLHGRVDLVARAVEEAGVDEDDPVLRHGDAGGEVGAGPALLVHDAQLDRVAGQAQGVLDLVEQAHRQGDLVRAVQLGLHHIDRTRRAVAAGALQVVQGGGHGHQGVDGRLIDRRPVQGDHVGQHVVADIAHQQERATAQHDLAAARGGVAPVLVQPPGLGAPALLEGGGQVAAHQAEPVAVDAGLVLGVDGGDGVLAVLDGGQGGFHQDVGHAGGVVLADIVGPVDLDLQVQAVVLQEDGAWRRRLAAPASQLRGDSQGHPAARDQGHRKRIVDDGVAGGFGM